jgi:hypothetical protein
MTKSQAIMGGIESAIMTQLAAGRNGIQTIFTFLDTQLPLPYVHIICLLVKVCPACAVEFALAPLNLVCIARYSFIRWLIRASNG